METKMQETANEVTWTVYIQNMKAGIVRLEITGEKIGELALFVWPHRRGLGLGSLLLEGAIKYAREHGLQVIKTKTLKFQGMDNLFQQLGFVLISTQPRTFVCPAGSAAHEELLMELKL